VVIDGDHPDVQCLAESVRGKDELRTVHTPYRVVRDEFVHSYDIGASEVSVSASDVIHHGHGICFAKAHLLAALLRSNAIPAGLCYRNLLVAIRIQEQPAYMA
jgi:transglutaminase-like putative cysteine protease